ncbi:MAG: hypothetical protein RLZZ175_2783 [Bacteroidota bacterium]|jgi:hypothetical protein
MDQPIVELKNEHQYKFTYKDEFGQMGSKVIEVNKKDCELAIAKFEKENPKIVWRSITKVDQPIVEKFNEDELSIISHTLGVNLELAIRSKKKKDKKLPKEFYRNYFCMCRVESLERLHQNGEKDYLFFEKLLANELAHKWERLGNVYYSISDKGIEKFKSEFNEIIYQ